MKIEKSSFSSFFVPYFYFLTKAEHAFNFRINFYFIGLGRLENTNCG